MLSCSKLGQAFRVSYQDCHMLFADKPSVFRTRIVTCLLLTLAGLPHQNRAVVRGAHPARILNTRVGLGF